MKTSTDLKPSKINKRILLHQVFKQSAIALGLISGLLCMNSSALGDTSTLLGFAYRCSFGGTSCPSGVFDLDTVRSQITVPSGYCPFGIDSVRVGTNIYATRLADVDMFLSGPDGTEMDLITDKCG